jgi:flagellar biogenesis protein FliO
MLDGKDFEDHFRAAWKIAIFGWCISLLASIAFLCFLAWVVVKIMAYFSVV